MKNGFEEIQVQIKKEFETYFNSLLFTKEIPRKYFYWSEDFFRREGNLNFNYFILSAEIKDSLNDLGRLFFDSDDIYFFVNKNSHRHDLTINNFIKIFNESNKKDQTLRYEYLKEFIFWKLLEQLDEKYKIDLEKLIKQRTLNPSKNIDIVISDFEDEIALLKKAIPIQYNNFLFTYVQYITKSGRNIENKDYIPFRSLLYSQYEKLIEDLKSIKNKTSKENKALKKKIDSLFIHKSFKSKIHFLFSK